MVRKRQAARRGVAAVEFAALLPLILILLVGIIEVGRLIEMQQVLSNAVREGARQASTGQLTNSQVKTVVTQYVAAAGFSTAHMHVSVKDLTHAGNDVSDAVYLDQLRVSLRYPYSNVSWSMLGWIVPKSFTLHSHATWMTMVDKAFPGFPDPPVG
jgi:Flp pilus assembly protein TadG